MRSAVYLYIRMPESRTRTRAEKAMTTTRTKKGLSRPPRTSVPRHSDRSKTRYRNPTKPRYTTAKAAEVETPDDKTQHASVIIVLALALLMGVGCIVALTYVVLLG